MLPSKVNFFPTIFNLVIIPWNPWTPWTTCCQRGVKIRRLECNPKRGENDICVGNHDEQASIPQGKSACISMIDCKSNRQKGPNCI